LYGVKIFLEFQTGLLFMDVEKQESVEEMKRSNVLVKRLALRGENTFVVSKDIKISLAFF
jgi:hypothetical protein